jgi:SGNH hydrolase-like domain, acetyltransferase AlgX
MDIFASDPVIGYTYEPNAKTYEKGKEYNAPYLINSLGLRDREYGAKKSGVFRVLLLGDSFSVSHGLPIESSLSRQMEKSMQEAADSDGIPIKFEVINAAVGGYSPYNYWKAYSRWAPTFKPDLVLVVLSPDDYECDNEYGHYLIEKGEILDIYKDGQQPNRGGRISIKKLRKWLSWNSEFYIIMRNFFYYNDIVSRIILWKSPGGVENDTQLQLYMVSQRENIKDAWSKGFSYLQRLQKEAAADGVTVILTKIPLKIEIDSTQYRQVLMTKGLKDEQIDLDQQLREISAFSKKENVPFLDPRQALRERNIEVPCYFVLDGHWNAEGIRIAAASMARQWRELALPPWTYQKAKSVHHVSPCEQRHGNYPG